MLAPVSPLEEVWLDGHSSRTFLKREDLVLPGGGNKVRRFQAFIKKHPQVKKVIALSNPGSHTFKILTSLLKEMKQEEVPNLVFLERAMSLTQYENQNREEYLNHPNIKSSLAPFWIQWFKWMYYKYLSQELDTQVIGIGGHTSVQPNPFRQALKECDQQLKTKGISGPVMHVLPIASGQMLDGLLAASSQSIYEHLFFCVMTGDVLTRPYLRFKYRKDTRVTLFTPNRRSGKEYSILADRFHDQTGVWLDPIHTIHLADTLQRKRQLFLDMNTVVWITCPYQHMMHYSIQPK